MKIIINLNKNTAGPRKIPEFTEFNLGTVDTTLQELLDSSTIQIDESMIPVLIYEDNDGIHKVVIPNINSDDVNETSFVTGQNLKASDLLELGGYGSGGSGPIDIPNLTEVLEQGNILPMDVDEGRYFNLQDNRRELIINNDDTELIMPENETFSIGDQIIINTVKMLPSTGKTLLSFEGDISTQSQAIFAGTGFVQYPFKNGNRAFLKKIADKLWSLSFEIADPAYLPTIEMNYLNDANAQASGIEIGKAYHTAGVVKIRLT